MQAVSLRMAPDTSRWSSMLANARKRLWWAAAAGLTIAIVFLLTGLAWPKRYSSNAYLEFFPIYDGASFPPVRPHFETWRRNALTREFLESLLDRYRLFPGQPAERRIERIQQAVVFSFTVREGLLRQRYGIQVGFVC